MSDAANIPYAQREPDDWTGSPLDVDGALDELASRTTDAETAIDARIKYADIKGNGIIARSNTTEFQNRTITAGTGITVTDGDGVSGNPTISTVVDFATQHATTAGTSGLVYLRCGSANNGASGVGGWAQAGFPYAATLIGYSVYEEITVYVSGAPVLRIIVVPPGGSSTTIDTTLATPSGTGNYYTTATVAAGTVDVDAGEFIVVALDHNESGSLMTTDDMVVRLYWRLT